MKHTHYIGQAVKCIDDTNQTPVSVTIPGEDITVGLEYIVRGISKDGGLLLAGVIGGYHWNGWECGFNSARFVAVEAMRESVTWSESLLEQLEQEINDEIWISKG